jgi:hypothetical protein
MSFAPLSFKAAGVLSAYRIVKITAANTVDKATAATDKLMGVTADEATAANQEIPVVTSGLVKVYFNDSCANGAFVTSDNLGQAIPAVANTAGVNVLGILVGAAVATTGTIAEVLIQPYQLQLQ